MSTRCGHRGASATARSARGAGRRAGDRSVHLGQARPRAEQTALLGCGTRAPACLRVRAALARRWKRRSTTVPRVPGRGGHAVRGRAAAGIKSGRSGTATLRGAAATATAREADPGVPGERSPRRRGWTGGDGKATGGFEHRGAGDGTRGWVGR